LLSTNSTAKNEPRTDQRAPRRIIFLFGRDCIFPPRPCASRRHGAQGRLKPGRFFSGHPQGSGLTGRAPCYACKRPWRSSARSNSRSCFLAAAIVARQGRDPRLPARRGSVARPIRAALLRRDARRAAERNPRPLARSRSPDSAIKVHTVDGSPRSVSI
jgi:hypothetical protein